MTPSHYALLCERAAQSTTDPGTYRGLMRAAELIREAPEPEMAGMPEYPPLVHGSLRANLDDLDRYAHALRSRLSSLEAENAICNQAVATSHEAAKIACDRCDEMEDRAEKAEAENVGLRAKCKRQRRELRRLNKYLGPYWTGFRRGIDMEAACKLRGIMNQAFGHKAVWAAEHAAINAARRAPAGEEEK